VCFLVNNNYCYENFHTLLCCLSPTYMFYKQASELRRAGALGVSKSMTMIAMNILNFVVLRKSDLHVLQELGLLNKSWS